MITVIAGVNGAGKSSVFGSFLRNSGSDYFNPDEVTRKLLAENPEMTEGEANGFAWKKGYCRLERAVDDDLNHTFETTLGGNSICELLHRAIKLERKVYILFCGLSSPELHIERVAHRVANNGHHIPDEKIRMRWCGAIRNMVGLIPHCYAARVFDNSAPLDQSGEPCPVTLFEFCGNEFLTPPVEAMPEWAMPLASAAIKRCRSAV